ncbi:hypothetical protein KFK09_028225 [Dendrobium nobile]|uniref:Uncharacterized protein n=1 Tax=Dendrobium nobile TaxID=94219 RepID=A0A8T3A1F0_DENNO|nr:hypothetical protein KFK09_028225 [Dendrobium nobile]
MIFVAPPLCSIMLKRWLLRKYQGGVILMFYWETFEWVRWLLRILLPRCWNGDFNQDNDDAPIGVSVSYPLGWPSGNQGSAGFRCLLPESWLKYYWSLFWRTLVHFLLLLLLLWCPFSDSLAGWLAPLLLSGCS